MHSHKILKLLYIKLNYYVIIYTKIQMFGVIKIFFFFLKKPFVLI